MEDRNNLVYFARIKMKRYMNSILKDTRNKLDSVIEIQIRNYIRTKVPDIDNIMSYQEYEDYTTNIVLNIIKN